MDHGLPRGFDSVHFGWIFPDRAPVRKGNVISGDVREVLLRDFLSQACEYVRSIHVGGFHLFLKPLTLQNLH